MKDEIYRSKKNTKNKKIYKLKLYFCRIKSMKTYGNTLTQKNKNGKIWK